MPTVTAPIAAPARKRPWLSLAALSGLVASLLIYRTQAARPVGAASA